MTYAEQTTAPRPIRSSTARWRTPEGGHRPVLLIASGRTRVFVDPADFHQLALSMDLILASEAAQAAETEVQA